MELALNRPFMTRKKLITWMIVAGLLCLLPLTIWAYATGGFASQILIGDSGVPSSQITVGTGGTPSGGYYTLESGTTGGGTTPVFSPTTGAGSFINIYLLVFVAMGLLAMLWYFMYGKEPMVFRIIICGVILYLMISFLPGLQATITNLFGGIPGI